MQRRPFPNIHKLPIPSCSAEEGPESASVPETYLDDCVITCLRRVSTSERDALARCLQSFGEVRFGTFCAGTDPLALVLKSLARVLRKDREYRGVGGTIHKVHTCVQFGDLPRETRFHQGDAPSPCHVWRRVHDVYASGRELSHRGSDRAPTSAACPHGDRRIPM